MVCNRSEDSNALRRSDGIRADLLYSQIVSFLTTPVGFEMTAAELSLFARA